MTLQLAAVALGEVAVEVLGESCAPAIGHG
jgi:hypothetical protein